MITAIVGLVGVIVGSVLTALLNFYLQKAAELRRWKREDERQQQLWEREDHTRFQADRLHLYRDFRVEVQRARNLERFTEAEMERMAAEIELISGPAGPSESAGSGLGHGGQRLQGERPRPLSLGAV